MKIYKIIITIMLLILIVILLIGFDLNDKEDYCYKIIDYNGTEKQLDYYSTYCYIQYGNMFCEYDHKVVKVLEYERVECYE